ncbi:MAG TPA: sigma 54-interacting transcriptional regulator, partial [Steroidobacteraceae bacterium]|nr:sigma 54-interacting transcriptional regulator [Steroidobacteraceae bacterium]
AIAQLREHVQRVAPHDTAVLLVGENGTGKQILARYIHDCSGRATRPFVPLAASSLVDPDATITLFGSEEGGIRRGVLDEAHGGTLYINDLAVLTSGVARLLLTSLERRAYTRVGGREPQSLDVRVMCSARDSTALTGAADADRKDLLTHLNAVTIQVPPVREYAEDVPELLRNHAESLVDEERLPLRRFGIAAQNRLRNYPWPGNVRELRNLVRRLLILGGSEEITLAEVERELQVQAGVDEPLVKQDLLALPLREAREQFERAYLQQQLQLCNGRVGLLAKRVGMERTHLYRKLRSLGIDFRQLAED